MKRTIIKIDENKCNGCGICVTGCHEGALQLINGKAVMVSELYCDGLGACIGDCPEGAIALEEREAEPYSEAAVMKRIVPKGESVILAHLNHLHEHGETELLRQGLHYLRQHNIAVDTSFLKKEQEAPAACACPGAMMREIKRPMPIIPSDVSIAPPPVAPASALQQFPVQLHLVNPMAVSFQGAHLLLAADCSAFAAGDFHNRFLRNRMLAIACPKLDSNTQRYIEKLIDMIDVAQIETLTVVIMEVPCCRGLLKIAESAREQANRHIPIKIVTLSVQGDVKGEQWI